MDSSSEIPCHSSVPVENKEQIKCILKNCVDIEGFVNLGHIC